MDLLFFVRVGLFFFFKYLITHLWTYRRDTKHTVHKGITQATTLRDLESRALKAENNYELNLLGKKHLNRKTCIAIGSC